MSRCLADGMTCAANASLISTRSMSSIVSPARSSAMRDAPIGPRPMISGFSAGDAARHDARERRDAELLGPGVAHHDDRGRAVVQRARVARGDRAVGPEHRLELRELLDGRAVARARRPSRATVPSGSVIGMISRSKNPLCCDSTARCCERAANSSISSRVTPSACDDVLRGLAHRDVDVGQSLGAASTSARRRPDRALRAGPGVGEPVVGGARAAVGAALVEAAHALDARGDEHVALAALDRVRGHADGLQRRRAVAVDGRAGDVVRCPRAARRRARGCSPAHRPAARSR